MSIGYIKNIKIDDRNVVPYNKFLLIKYNCHINTEICTSINSVKYIFKYIYKGYDCANINIMNNNEIEQEFGFKCFRFLYQREGVF